AIPPWLPNVCEEQEMSMLGLRQPCVQAFTRMVKVWRQGCSSQRWCMGYERSGVKNYMDAQCVLSFFLVCSDINECADSNGGCEGTCCNIIGSFYCRCPDGMKLGADGKSCQGEKVKLSFIICDPGPQNHGKLISCEHRCVDLGNKQYKCECRSNYQLKRDGKHCELKDPCKEHNGGCAHICSNVNGQVQCSCRSGYRMGADFKRCEDIDECVSGQAKCAHGCVNFPGSFHCVCNPGFELGADGKQCYRNVFFPHENMLLYLCASSTDTDECENGEACCSHYCKNYPGGYECGCRPGYTPNGCTCDDIDECLSETSGCSQYCVNTLGSYECFCQVGFRLDYDQKSCLREKSCLPHSQEVMHRLQNKDELEEEEEKEVVGSEDEPEIRTHEYVDLSVSVSVCEEGSFGDDCSVSCEDCVNGGVCALEKDRCVCAPGWMGVTCNDTCAQGTYGVQCNSLCVCKNGGHCDPVTGKCLCCPQGFYGRFCRRRCNCPNNGRCHRLYGGCLCTPGLYGKFCHLPCPKWTHGAGCLEECKCTCTCKPGYHGDRCQEECDKGYYGIGCCERCNCSDGETCDPKTGECQKMCPAGYHGEKCQLACPAGTFGPNCSQSCDCHNGGSCDPVSGQCRCTPGWTGTSCQQTPIHMSSHKLLYSVSITHWNVHMGERAPLTLQSICFLSHCLYVVCIACASGWFGRNCEQRCICPGGVACDHVTGRCGCPAGYTGNSCETSRCDFRTGSCICQPGYLGPNCSTSKILIINQSAKWVISGKCKVKRSLALKKNLITFVFFCPFISGCPTGRYGRDCAQVCLCGEGGQCHPETGRCNCAPGRTGPSCEQACSRGHYGAQCRSFCMCANGGVCDPVNGTCRCGLGWTGQHCEKGKQVHKFNILYPCKCPAGFFGELCAQSCDCKPGHLCDHVTGQCLCPPGYQGDKCEKRKSSRF
uniref:Zgc:158328 n=1 Tax=Sinocyclocheilus anshuiensis TaxID=1608454 RepID=A0A671MG02_9TELE